MMLATTWEKDNPQHRDALFTYMGEEKLNGVRTNIRLSPDGNHRVITRTKSVRTSEYVDKSNHILWLPDVKVHEEVVLDGEIHLGMHSRASRVMSIFGCEEGKALDMQREGDELYFTVFDVIGEVQGQRLRSRLIDEVVSDLNFSHIDVVTRMEDLGFDSMLKFYDHVVERGGEGIILKNPWGLYVPHKRPANTWLKMKPVHRICAVVMGEEFGNGKYEDMIGALNIGLFKDGRLRHLCRIGSGFTDEDRCRLDWTGQVVVVAFSDITDKGTPELPRYKREEPWLDGYQCTFDQLEDL